MVRQNANWNNQLWEEYKWLDGAKNRAWELCKAYTSLDIRYWKSTQWNKMRRQIREKRVKSNEQSPQEIWDYVKRPNIYLIGVPESDENGTKLEYALQDIIQENFPSLARQANIQTQEIQRTPQRCSSRKATWRHIIIRFTKVELKEKCWRQTERKVGLPTKGSPSD